MNGQDFYIKVCGMTKGQEIQALENMDVDFIGINFYPLSPRYAADMPSFLPEFAHRVGVFVNADMHTICSKAIPIDWNTFSSTVKREMMRPNLRLSAKS